MCVAPGSTSQPPATTGFERSGTGTHLPEFAAFRPPLGTSLVQRAGARGGVRYATVRECARALGVSTATVYRAVARGQIPHVRVSNAIRIPVPVEG
jgi:excisionase family DNA binding protein